jgi:alanyl-tRNA synthetase
VIEIWNLVFIQFNRGRWLKLRPCPPSTSTPAWASSASTTTTDRRRRTPETRRTRDAAAADEAYVLRCALILAMAAASCAAFGWQYLNLHEPFLCKLVDTVVETMGDAFPELKQNPAHVKAIIREEEESFGRTLDRGIALFEEAATRARNDHHHEIRGEDAFKLHDTYGFPIDLTQIMAEEQKLKVDIGEYERLMDAARERARAGGKDTAVEAAIPPELVAPFGPTEETPKFTEEALTARLRAIVRLGDNGPELLDSPGATLAPGERAGLIFDRTCFYAEAGGQVGDIGQAGGTMARFDIEDTQRISDTVVHVGTQVMGNIAVGEDVEIVVNAKRRDTMKNHTATHVLNWALREVLGDHVQQKGSLVDPDKTRFDFAHPKALTAEEVAKVEDLVNERIADALPVHYQEVPQEEALQINGLRAVFGERYPDIVRVVSCGVSVDDLLSDPQRADWQRYPIEFCGGTHLRNTSEIERFVLVSEEAVAKGIRRVVGLTGQTAVLTHECGAALAQRAEEVQQSPPEDLHAEVAELTNGLAGATISIRDRARVQDLISDLQKQVKKQQKAAAADAADVINEHVRTLADEAERVGDVAIVVGEVPEVPADQLKGAADLAKQKCGSAAVLLGMKSGEKAVLLAAMTDDLIKRGLKAGDLVKETAKLVQGGGGGPPTMAQAGGKDPSQLPAALEAGKTWIRNKLQS